MRTDEVYDFIAKYWDIAVIVGTPAICVLAFVLLQEIGVKVIGTVRDYMQWIAVFYGGIFLVLCGLGFIAIACEEISNWDLRVLERRVRRMELEAQEKALEASCTRSQDSF